MDDYSFPAPLVGMPRATKLSYREAVQTDLHVPRGGGGGGGAYFKNIMTGCAGRNLKAPTIHIKRPSL